MSSALEQLLQYIQELRSSESAGCPWTKAQTADSLLPLTLEEMYEFIEAHRQQNQKEWLSELGDMLYHVLFYLVLEIEKSGQPSPQYLQRLVEAIIEKHEQRLPPPAERAHYNPEQMNDYWQKKKAKLRPPVKSALTNIPVNCPSLLRANIIQRYAAQVGFDWENAQQALEKLEEETRELQHEIQHNTNSDRLQDEMGDVLFTCVNLSRHLNIDPEIALHHANEKFIRRFKHVENQAQRQNIQINESSMDDLGQLWQQAKESEK